MIVAVGDIHGQADPLDRLLQRILSDLDPSDTLVFLGDYIDRGPGSRQVVERLLELDTPAQTIFLMGNHEELALSARDGFAPKRGPEGLYLSESDPAREWFSQGGEQTLASYGLDLAVAEDDEYLAWREAIPEGHWQFLGEGSLEYVTDAWHFVHAGLLPSECPVWEYQGMGIAPQRWVREPFLSWEGGFEGRRVVFGHTPQPNGMPLVEGNKIGIDTGAAWGGPLTAALLSEEGELVGFLQAIQGRVEELAPWKR